MQIRKISPADYISDPSRSLVAPLPALSRGRRWRFFGSPHEFEHRLSCFICYSADWGQLSEPLFFTANDYRQARFLLVRDEVHFLLPLVRRGSAVSAPSHADFFPQFGLIAWWRSLRTRRVRRQFWQRSGVNFSMACVINFSG
jgi:hypothetical protein